MKPYRMFAGFLLRCAAIAVLLGLFPVAAHAYELAEINGKYIMWLNNPPGATYVINETGGPAGAATAIQDSMKTWNDVPTSTFSFRTGTPSTNTTWGLLDYKNIMMFGTSGDLGFGVIACNGFWFDNTTGEMFDSDIIFNTNLQDPDNPDIVYDWAVIPVLDEDNINPSYQNSFDVQNIATHELGHTLCLADLYEPSVGALPGDTNKTMYGYGAPGETKKWTLDQDDIDGITFLYSNLAKYPTTLNISLVKQDGLNITLSVTLIRTDTLAAVPGKTVYIFDGTIQAAIGVTDATGNFTTTVTSTLGPHSYTATYNGDAESLGSTPATAVVAVVRLPMTLGLSLLSQDGTNVTLTANLKRTDNNDPVPGKTVYLLDGTTQKVLGVTDVKGNITRTIVCSPGSPSYTAKLNTDATCAEATSAPVAVVVGKVAGLSPANNANVTTATPTLSWTAYAGATAYRVQVATSYTFDAASLRYDAVTVGAPISITSPALTFGTVYYWRVHAVLATGTSIFSDSCMFTYKNGTTLLLSPVTQDGLKVTFAVTLTGGGPLSGKTVSFYDGTLLKASGVTLTDGTLTKTITSTVGNHTYSAKFAGSASLAPVQTLAQAVSIGKPVLISPAYNATVTTATPTLKWSFAGTATSYHVQVATSSTFGAATLLPGSDTVGAPTTLISPALTAGKIYYWRVQAVLASGKSIYSDYSRLTYKVGTTLSVSGTVLDGTNVTFTVLLKYGLTNLGGKTVYFYDGGVLKGSGVTLSNGTLIKSIASTVGDHSFVAKFAGDTAYVLAQAAPVAATISKVTLTFPANSAVVVTPTPVLQWSFTGTATDYHVQVATSSTFGSASLVYDSDTGSTATSLASPSLAAGTPYYWRVQAAVAGGKSVYSNCFKVTYTP